MNPWKVSTTDYLLNAYAQLEKFREELELSEVVCFELDLDVHLDQGYRFAKVAVQAWESRIETMKHQLVKALICPQ